MDNLRKRSARHSYRSRFELGEVSMKHPLSSDRTKEDENTKAKDKPGYGNEVGQNTEASKRVRWRPIPQ